MKIVWVEDSMGKTIYIQSFGPKQEKQMMDAYRYYLAMPKVKAFKMPLDELVIDIRINTEI